MKKTKRNETETAARAAFRKVAECLYRNESSGIYYALVERAGKQFHFRRQCQALARIAETDA